MTKIAWKAHPKSKNFDDNTNWVGGTTPGISDVAVFGASSKTSLIFSAGSTQIGAWNFKPSSPHYTFTLNITVTPFLHVQFEGAGITGQSGTAKIVNDHGFLEFFNSSTPGNAHISSDAQITFSNSSSAGKASIANHHNINFLNTSSAGNAKISDIAGGAVIFQDSSRAGNAKISNDGDVVFHDDSSAENSTIINAKGVSCLVQFDEHSDGGTARLIASAGSKVDFSGSTGPGGGGKIGVGSIAGAGEYDLGSNALFVGFANNRSGTVSGAVNDGGFGGGTGATLVKQGTGTLKLSHAGNTYSGGTSIVSGTFDVAALGAAGTGSIDFDTSSNGKQVLKIENAALSNHTFSSNIANHFGIGDTIDLAGLKFVTHAKATLNGTTLTVKSGHVTDTLTLLNSDPTGVLQGSGRSSRGNEDYSRGAQRQTRGKSPVGSYRQ